MIFKTIAAVLVCVLLHTSVAAEEQPSQTQTVDKMQQVLHKAQDKDKAVKITLRKKMDNQRKFMGKVKEITDAGFSIVEQKTGRTMSFAYQDVQQVGQAGVSKGTIIAVVALVAGGLIILGILHYELGKS